MYLGQRNTLGVWWLRHLPVWSPRVACRRCDVTVWRHSPMHSGSPSTSGEPPASTSGDWAPDDRLIKCPHLWPLTFDLGFVDMSPWQPPPPHRNEMYMLGHAPFLNQPIRGLDSWQVMINRFALSFLCIELDRTRNVRGHATLYTTDRKSTC